MVVSILEIDRRIGVVGEAGPSRLLVGLSWFGRGLWRWVRGARFELRYYHH